MTDPLSLAKIARVQALMQPCRKQNYPLGGREDCPKETALRLCSMARARTASDCSWKVSPEARPRRVGIHSRMNGERCVRKYWATLGSTRPTKATRFFNCSSASRGSQSSKHSRIFAKQSGSLISSARKQSLFISRAIRGKVITQNSPDRSHGLKGKEVGLSMPKND